MNNPLMIGIGVSDAIVVYAIAMPKSGLILLGPPMPTRKHLVFLDKQEAERALNFLKTNKASLTEDITSRLDHVYIVERRKDSLTLAETGNSYLYTYEPRAWNPENDVDRLLAEILNNP